MKTFLFLALTIAALGAHADPDKMETVPKRAPASQHHSSDDLIYKFTLDLGVSSGTYNNISYTEADLGLNTYFSPYFDFRNAAWVRWPSGQSTIYGLDSSARGVLSEDFGGFGFTVFAGPGLRFPSQGNVTPFAEGGALLKVAGLALGLGVKSILDSWVTSGAPNDTEVFIIIGIGSGI